MADYNIVCEDLSIGDETDELTSLWVALCDCKYTEVETFGSTSARFWLDGGWWRWELKVGGLVKATDIEPSYRDARRALIAATILFIRNLSPDPS